ncbi:IS66 family transposase [Belnapia rosea]|uniref:Transposase n=1 Tax=Belnapia rosea TaxID=938405 RepID=A0A1G6Z2U2_9PROT|nr:Transposase [Belnapia rosea]
MREGGETTPDLPDDPAVLRAMLLAALAERDNLAAERDSIVAERDALAERNERLHHLLRKLQRMQFGPRSERLPEEQLQFAFEEVEASLASNEAEAEKRLPDLRQKNTARRRAGRGRLPAHLPRIEQVLLPESTACPCCRGRMVEIGADTAERLDVHPAQFRVLVTRRPKFACRACQGVVVQAPAPARLIEGGMPTEATVAQVLVARYADHMPLYRQAQSLARQGIEIGREVLAGWLGAAAFAVRPVVARMREILLASGRLFADETGMPVLEPGRGKTKKGYAWAIARDDRPWGGADPPAVVFHYAPGRGAEHARDLLAGYTGLLQCDGYAAYKGLAAKDGGTGVTLVYCWTHVRREFFDLAKSNTAPIAEKALQRIAALYAVEDTIRGKPPDIRRATRQARSRPLVAGLFAWLEQQLVRLPGRSPTAEAIRYALNHRDGLEQFLEEGRAEIDSNTVERAIRPVVLSRKNALFASGDDGGRRWADFASLVETCKLNGINPQVYFTDLLTRLVNGWPQSRIDELMPWHWATAKAG